MTMTEQTPASAARKSMRAVTMSAYGSADVLSVETIKRPTIKPDQVLVEVQAAGLDRGVWHLMSGLPYIVRLMGYGLTKPSQPVPGFDVAGRVVEIGNDVTRFAVGDEVFGVAVGAFAEFAAADEKKLVHKPESVSFEQAGVAAISGLTALQSVADIGAVEAGQRVLVLGASGGVGSYAVQVAKALGATVTGVASTSKLDFVRSIGADEVVDYTRQSIDELDTTFDLIIDTGGRNPISTLRKVLAPKGTLVIVGGEGGGKVTGGFGRQIRASLMSPFVSQRLAMLISKEDYSDIERLARLMESGEVVPAIGQRFDLEGVPEAMRLMEAGQLSGKAVIAVGSSSRG